MAVHSSKVVIPMLSIDYWKPTRPKSCPTEYKVTSPTKLVPNLSKSKSINDKERPNSNHSDKKYKKSFDLLRTPKIRKSIARISPITNRKSISESSPITNRKSISESSPITNRKSISESSPITNRKSNAKDAIRRSSAMLHKVTVELFSPDTHLDNALKKQRAYSYNPPKSHEKMTLTPVLSHPVFYVGDSIIKNKKQLNISVTSSKKDENAQQCDQRSNCDVSDLKLEDFPENNRMSLNSIQNSRLSLNSIENSRLSSNSTSSEEHDRLSNSQLEQVIMNILEDSSQSMTYDPTLSCVRSQDISVKIENEIKSMINQDRECPYRVVVQVFMGALKDDGMTLAAECDADLFALATVKQKDMFISGVVIAG